MKKVRVFWQVVSMLALCSLILVSIFLCFEIKSWGVSNIELVIFFISLLIVCYLLSSLTMNVKRETSTLVCLSILMILLMALEICCITVVKDVIQAFLYL